MTNKSQHGEPQAPVKALPALDKPHLLDRIVRSAIERELELMRRVDPLLGKWLL